MNNPGDTLGTDRAAFFDRVRAATAAGLKYRVHVADVPANAGYVGAGDDVCRRMADEVNAVGGTAHLVGDVAAARAKLEELLRQYAPTSAFCWQHPLLDRLELGSTLQTLGVAKPTYESLHDLPLVDQRKRMFAADVGISSATYAVAETGTLAMLSGPGRERVASLLPPVHIAVIERAQILPDLFDLFAALDTAGSNSMPSNLTLITGPSKTGDIELQLTTGVHGPGEWHVVIISGQ